MRRAVSRRGSDPAGLSLIKTLVAIAILSVTIALLLPPVRQPDSGWKHNTCRNNNLKSLALAMHEYAEDFGTFPPAYTVDANGNPLHSWRTLVLPYVDQKELYESIDLSKPWDDPVNADAFNQIPDVYVCPVIGGASRKTLYLGVVGPGAFFTGATPRKPNEVTDKEDETLVLVEVPEQQGVPWMAPLDVDEKLILSFDAKTKWPHPKRRFAAFVDISVKSLPTTTTPKELRRMLSIAGGD